MGSIARAASRALRKVVSTLADLLPSPPSHDAAPPDIDGRRPTEADVTQIDVDIERKAGRGGYR